MDAVRTLIIATRNVHKVQEIRALLGDAVHYLTLHDFPGAPAVIEDADSFVGNANKKAVELARWITRRAPESAAAPPAGTESYCLADDSGLEVDALGGAPGVLSARFAGAESGSTGNSSDQANNAKLLRLLEKEENRAARFRCCIALTPVLRAAPEPASPVCAADEAEWRTEIFEGTCEGWIERAPRGAHGFGYDPLFVPTGHQHSFAELGSDVKNHISHRAKALQKLQQRLKLGFDLH